ncbi:MAG: hypothetical protein EXR98_00060 [Gemmataceae bacterium]|nr:hypothetical protein [Gemmataceae bacterium]
MSQSLSLELSDKVYATIRQQAETAGTSPAQVVVAALEERFNGNTTKADPRTEAEKQAARDRFECHFGAVNLGYPTGTDNEAIDADLAREYADNHEED